MAVRVIRPKRPVTSPAITPRERRENAPIAWLERAVPLWPKHSRVLVHGVSSDADKALRNYWLQLGRTAAAGSTGKD
jgi:hypothetical protein